MENNQNTSMQKNANISNRPIEKELLEAAYKKALVYSERKLSKFHESGLLSKITSEDVTNEAVSKTLSGKRPWNRESNPDLFVHLAGCISSEISNSYNSADFQVVERGVLGNEAIMAAIDNELSPADAMEFESKVTFILDYLVSLRKDIEPVATLILKSGVTGPKDIASHLGMSLSEVNSKKLAIRRMMLRSDFILHYISSNRKDLLAIALAVYRDKIVDAKDLSNILGISVSEARGQSSKLYSVVDGINKGVI